jgi:2-hydroxymuconate-semialdehyde hydrolase
MSVGPHQVMVARAGAGAGPAVVFLHGGGPGASGWSNWRLALEALGDRYDCIAPDYVGYGDSTHPEPPPTDMRVWTRMRLDQIIGMLDALEIERAHLVGNSLGGALTLHLLMEAPDRFERAVLMGTAGGPSSDRPSQELIRMVTFYSDPSPEALGRLYSWFVHDPDDFNGDLDAIARDRYAMTMREDVRRSYVAQFTGPSQLTLPDSALRRIQHPILLVHGRDDMINPVSDSYHFLQVLPNAQLDVFGRCGHWTQLEYPQRFNHLVDEFLRGAL